MEELVEYIYQLEQNFRAYTKREIHVEWVGGMRIRVSATQLDFAALRCLINTLLNQGGVRLIQPLSLASNCAEFTFEYLPPKP
jgi:hypothetical protein